MVRTLDTNSEAWRFECECRYVMSLPDREARRQYLDGVKIKRGEAAMLHLEDGIQKLWDVRVRKN